MSPLRRVLVLIVVLVIVLGGAGFAQSSTGQKLLRDAGITGTSSGLVELSFDGAQTLPFRIPSVEAATLQLPFTVHNASSRPRIVTWRVIVTGSDVVGVRGVPASLTETQALAPHQAINPQLALTLVCHRATRIEIALDTGQRIGVGTSCFGYPYGRVRGHGARRAHRTAAHRRSPARHAGISGGGVGARAIFVPSRGVGAIGVERLPVPGRSTGPAGSRGSAQPSGATSAGATKPSTGGASPTDQATSPNSGGTSPTSTATQTTGGTAEGAG